MALISLDHVSKIYPKGTRPALDDVNLDIDRGDFVFLVGASGSGKTTLLSLLLREEEATDGEIRVAGNDLRRISDRQVPQYRRTIGFVFQDYKLLNNKTVWQNVAFALEVIGTRRSAIKSMVPKVLETVGLTGKEDSYPHELSGGEQQRVAIARAYVNHPQILLADEPTGNLDPTTSVGIMEVLEAVNRTGTTVVMATHNEEIVNSMRKRVIELHTGKIVRDEAQGSYDSALYFPDAQVEANAQQAISGHVDDARFRPAGQRGATDEAASIPGRKRDATAIEATMAVSQGIGEDEGIARLASSMHSGRTGRYGEAFAPVETTLTWGKGLDLESLAAKEKARAEEAAGQEPEVDDATAAETLEPDDMTTAGNGNADEPTPLETTQAFDPLAEGWEPLDPAQAHESHMASVEQTLAERTSSEPSPDDGATDAEHAEPTEPVVPPMPPAPPAPPAAAPGIDRDGETRSEDEEEKR